MICFKPPIKTKKKRQHFVGAACVIIFDLPVVFRLIECVRELFSPGLWQQEA